MRRRVGWIELLRFLAAVQAFLLALAAFALSDVEAAGFTILTVAVILLTYWRRGIAGTVALGLLFVDVTYWMAPGWISNLRHHERVAASVAPALLATVAVCGIATAGLRLILRPDRADRADARPAAVVVAVVLALAAAVTLVRSGSGQSDRARPGDVTLVMHGVKFAPSALRASSAVGVEVTNHDLFWHTFTVKGKGINVRVPVGGHRRTSLNGLAPGRYRFYCRIPGHESAGMKGTLTIDP
jgi:plastocyanin